MSEKEGKAIRLGLDYEIVVTDKEGNILSKCSKTNGSDPFVMNFIRILKAVFASRENDVDSIALTDTLGVSRTFYGCEYPTIGARAEAGDNTSGAVVGTSDLAFVRSQTKLDTRITHGNEAGQLLYSETTIEAAAEENGTGRFRIIRGFTNSSGGNVTVKEIAVYIWNSDTPYSFMISRDVLESPQTVPDGATLTLRYRMFVSYT